MRDIGIFISGLCIGICLCTLKMLKDGAEIDKKTQPEIPPAK